MKRRPRVQPRLIPVASTNILNAMQKLVPSCRKKISMKRLTPVALVIIALIAFSCNKKKYTCTCVKVEGKYNPDTLYYAIPAMKPHLATAECHAKSFYFAGVVYSCKLD